MLKIFPNLSTDVLCKLVEMPSYSPSDVFALVPKATPEQMGEFYKIVEDIEESGRPDKVQLPNEETKVKEELGFGKSIETQGGQSVPDSCTNLLQEIKDSINKLSSDKNVALTFSEQFQNNLLHALGLLNQTPLSEDDIFRSMFDKPRKNSLERSNLKNIHLARGYQYGIAHLGKKDWYTENSNLAKELKSQSDRRKFRAGLKADVDFINQLNMFDFEECFKGGSSHELQVLKLQKPLVISELKDKLKDVSPFELINFLIRKRLIYFSNILKISYPSLILVSLC